MPIIWCSMPVVCWSCPEIGPSRLVIQQSLCRFHPVLRIDRPICLVRPDWDVAIQRTEMGCGNYGNPWKPMETHGNPWKPMETHGNPWKPSYVKGQPRQPTFNLRRYKTPEPPWLWPKLWWNSPAPGKRSEITTVGKKTTSNPSHGEFMRIQHQIASLLLNILLNWPKSRCHISIYIYISHISCISRSNR